MVSIACVVSGHVWMKFENEDEMILVCARVPCGIKVKVKYEK